MKNRVALYIRVSTEEQAQEGFSLEAQEETLSKFCDMYSYTIFEKYIDDGKSGKNTDRPELQRLLKDCAKKKFDMVLVWKISRLSRNLKNLLVLVEEFEEYDVSFVSFSEKFDTSSAVGKLTLQVLGSIAEFERNTIIDNVRLGMSQRARSGKWSGGRVIGYDIVNKELVINEDEAQIVRLIFEMYVDGIGCIQIRDKLNQLNLKTKGGNSFTHIAINTILTNPVYKGYVRYGRTSNYDNKKKRKKEESYILVEGKHKSTETIIDEETFEKVQIMIEQNRRATRRMPSNPHLLSGLLRCPECDGRMNYQPAGQRKHNDKHGGYYTCSKYKNTRECTPNVVKAKNLEQAVLERIHQIIKDEHVIGDIVDDINSGNNIDTKLIQEQIVETERQIKKTDSRLQEIKKEYINEVLTLNEYRDFKGDIEQTLYELKTKRESMEIEFVKACNTTIDSKEVYFVLKEFDTLMEAANVQLKKRLLESIIERINLNPDKTLGEIEFTFEVPNQHATESNDKNVILTCDTVPRAICNGMF